MWILLVQAKWKWKETVAIHTPQGFFRQSMCLCFTSFLTSHIKTPLSMFFGVCSCVYITLPTKKNTSCSLFLHCRTYLTWGFLHFNKHLPRHTKPIFYLHTFGKNELFKGLRLGKDGIWRKRWAKVWHILRPADSNAACEKATEIMHIIYQITWELFMKIKNKITGMFAWITYDTDYWQKVLDWDILSYSC